MSRRGQTIVNGPQPPRNAGVINFHPGVPETASFPFSIWSSLLVRNSRSRDESLMGYLSFAGHPGLRATIASNISVSRGINCTADQVIIVTGAQAALDLVSRVLMDEGDHVWMEEPGYLGAKSAFLASGAKLAALKVDRRGWNLADPDLPPPRLIYVTPSCQWPFGTIMRIEERLQLLDIAERHGAWVIEDDYDGEYRFRGRPVPALRGLDHSDRVVYIGSFGKTLIPALRIGYLIVPRELSDSFDKAVSITGQFAPLILQATVNDFIKQGYFATHLKRMRRLYARRQANFIKLCREHLGEWISVTETTPACSFWRALPDRSATATWWRPPSRKGSTCRRYRSTTIRPSRKTACCSATRRWTSARSCARCWRFAPPSCGSTGSNGSSADDWSIPLDRRASILTHKGRSNTLIEHRNNPKPDSAFRSDTLDVDVAMRQFSGPFHGPEGHVGDPGIEDRHPCKHRQAGDRAKIGIADNLLE